MGRWISLASGDADLADARRNIDALIQASGRDLQALRDALEKEKARNLELTGRLDAIIAGFDASAVDAGNIAIGLDGDIDLARKLGNQIQAISDRVREVSSSDGSGTK